MVEIGESVPNRKVPIFDESLKYQGVETDDLVVKVTVM